MQCGPFMASVAIKIHAGLKPVNATNMAAKPAKANLTVWFAKTARCHSAVEIDQTCLPSIVGSYWIMISCDISLLKSAVSCAQLVAGDLWPWSWSKPSIRQHYGDRPLPLVGIHLAEAWILGSPHLLLCFPKRFMQKQQNWLELTSDDVRTFRPLSRPFWTFLSNLLTLSVRFR